MIFRGCYSTLCCPYILSVFAHQAREMTVFLSHILCVFCMMTVFLFCCYTRCISL